MAPEATYRDLHALTRDLAAKLHGRLALASRRHTILVIRACAGTA